jgi:predicted small secreted protein
MRIDSDGNLLFGVTATGNNGAFFTPSSNNRTVLFLGTSTTSTSTVQVFKNSNGTVGTISVSGSATAFNTSSDYRLKENVTGITDGITRVKQLNPSRFNFIADADTTVDGFLAHEAQTVVPEAITGEKDAMRDEKYEVTPATGDIFTPASAATFDKDGNELTAAVDEVVHSTDVEQPDELADGQEWRETTAAVIGTRTVPDYQGIDQSKLVPLLTAALQEAIAKIEALETRVAALEA